MADTVGAAYVTILPDLSKFPGALKAGVSAPTTSAMGEVTKASSAAFGGVATEAEKAGGRIGSALSKGGNQGVSSIRSLQGAMNEAGVATSPLLNKVLSLSSSLGTLRKHFPSLQGEASTAAQAVAGGLSKAGAEAQAAGGALTAMGAEGSAAATGMSGGLAIILVALAAVAAFAVSGIHSYLELTASVRAFQRVAGGSAEDASRMVAVANALGVSTETLARSMFKLNNSIDSTKFAELGIEIVKTKTGAVDSLATFLNVADAVQQVGKGAEASKIAMAAFGKGGSSLLPILFQDREHLKAFWDTAAKRGDIFTQADLNTAAQFGVNMRQLREGVGSLGRQLAQALMPALTAIVGGLQTGITAVSQLAHILGAVAGNEVVLLGIALLSLLNPITATITGIALVVAALRSFGVGVNSAADAIAREKTVLADNAKQYTDLQTAVVGNLTAQRAAETATLNVTRAADAEAKAQAALSKLKQQGAVDSKAVTSALRSQESAAHGTETATRTLATAQAAFNKLAGGPDIKTLAADMKALDTATDSVAKAVDRVRVAKHNLDVVLQGATARDLADASENVTKAQIAEQRSTIALADAQDKLAATQAAASPLALAQAQINLDKATADLAATQRNIRATSDDLTLANAKVADASAKLAALQAVGTPTARDLALANLDVQSSQLSAHDATLAVADAQQVLTDVQNRGKQGSADLQAAQASLATEEENLTNAISSQADAQAKIDELRAQSLPGSAQYEAAQQAVRDAVYGVAQAHQAAADASTALRTAQAGDPAFAEKLVAANEAVHSASQGVADAKMSDLVATLALGPAAEKLAGALKDDASQIDPLVKAFQQMARDKPELEPLLNQLIQALGGPATSASTRDLSGASMETKLAAIGYTPGQIAETMRAVAAGAPRAPILQHWRDLGHGPTGLPIPPGFAGGGWVGGGSFGQPVLIMAHVGERVQTAAQAQTGSVTIDARSYFSGAVSPGTLPDVQAMIDASNRKILDALRARGAA